MPIRHVQRVEGVEEPFLRLLLADKELDVVEQQHARAAVLLPELFGLALANGADVLVGELFGCRVDEAHAFGKRLLSDSVHQVRLAQPDFRVHHQRVIDVAGVVRDGARGGVRQLVRLAHYEAVEGVAAVQRGRWRPVGL